MAISVVRFLSGGATSALSAIASGTFTSTTGNGFVVGLNVASANMSVVSSVKNAAGVSFTAITSSLATNGSTSQQLWYLPNITGQVNDQIIITFVGTPSFTAAGFWEISGLNTSPLDPSGVIGTVGTGSTVTSGAISTPLNPNEIIIAIARIAALGQTFTAQSSPAFVLDAAQVPSGGYSGMEHRIVSSNQVGVTVSMTGTTSTTNFISVASFQAPASGSTISGSAGVAGASVAYSGTASGSVTADGSGNYTITGLADGPYTITPSLTGYIFTPTSTNVTVAGSNVSGINFTATSVGFQTNPITVSAVMTSGWRASQLLNLGNQPTTAQNSGITIPSQFGLNVYKIEWKSPATFGDTFTIVDPQNNNVLFSGTCGKANKDITYKLTFAANWRDFKVSTLSSGTLLIWYRS